MRFKPILVHLHAGGLLGQVDSTTLREKLAHSRTQIAIGYASPFALDVQRVALLQPFGCHAATGQVNTKSSWTSSATASHARSIARERSLSLLTCPWRMAMPSITITWMPLRDGRRLYHSTSVIHPNSS